MISSSGFSNQFVQEACTMYLVYTIVSIDNKYKMSDNIFINELNIIKLTFKWKQQESKK